MCQSDPKLPSTTVPRACTTSSTAVSAEPTFLRPAVSQTLLDSLLQIHFFAFGRRARVGDKYFSVRTRLYAFKSKLRDGTTTTEKPAGYNFKKTQPCNGNGTESLHKVGRRLMTRQIITVRRAVSGRSFGNDEPLRRVCVLSAPTLCRLQVKLLSNDVLRVRRQLDRATRTETTLSKFDRHKKG